eukprot:TRINITY_DN1399_c0_g1_i1.p1 TRINITY_DN1399_c0_g1~~TRINITY_DN1399_c0_g1_i1.p1  ORF type:complete len:123 (+),score=8.84 TRINITY_DN1399_c0_g1_i1:53-421(+)
MLHETFVLFVISVSLVQGAANSWTVVSGNCNFSNGTWTVASSSTDRAGLASIMLDLDVMDFTFEVDVITLSEASAAGILIRPKVALSDSYFFLGVLQPNSSSRHTVVLPPPLLGVAGPRDRL